MSNTLTKICADKVKHIAESRVLRSLLDVEADAKMASKPRGFYSALKSATAKEITAS